MPYRTLLVALLLPFCAAAQESRNGPKIGFGIATQTYGQFLAWNGQPKFGPLAGWSFEAPVTSQISLLIEPMYISKGSVTVNSAIRTRTSITLGYLEMPLLLKLSTNPDPQGTFLTGGLLYGYLISSKVRNYLDGRLVDKNDYILTNSTHRGQWSAALGIGHEKGNWMWELRGQNTLNTFDALAGSHNVMFSLQVAWRFPTRTERTNSQKAGAEGRDSAD
jgi:hypothetical protein